MIADSQTAEALLAYICRHPAEDAARLALADVLEERGEDSRAAFIRCQVELAGFWPTAAEWALRPTAIRHEALRRRERELWQDSRDWRPQRWFEIPGWGAHCPHDRVEIEYYPPGAASGAILCPIRRGFPDEISLTAEVFAGGPCRRCNGRGFLGGVAPGRAGWIGAPECPECHGSGRTPGHAAALFRGAPIVGVKLDREPWTPGVGQDRYWMLQDEDDGARCRWALPGPLYDLLAGSTHSLDRNWKRWDTEALALDALAAAALLLGRRRGWPCPRCAADGKAHGSDRPFEWQPVGGWPGDCPLCHGLGHTVAA